jgi:hypothetical protein
LLTFSPFVCYSLLPEVPSYLDSRQATEPRIGIKLVVCIFRPRV